MDWHSIYIEDKKIFLFENVAFSQFLTLEIAYSEKLRLWYLSRESAHCVISQFFSAFSHSFSVDNFLFLVLWFHAGFDATAVGFFFG